MAFGTKFSPNFHAHRRSIYISLLAYHAQPCGSAAARAEVDVPGPRLAAKHTNAQATARELIIIFVNFAFIVIVSFCLSFVVLAFFSSHREESFLAVH